MIPGTTTTWRRKILQPHFAFFTWLSEKGSGYRAAGSNQASCFYPHVDSASSSSSSSSFKEQNFSGFTTVGIE
jgi:hypothetical protein